MKTLKAALSLLLSSLVIFSCAKNPAVSDSTIEGAATETEPETTTVIRSKDRLGSHDFEGSTYSILGREYAKLGSLTSYEFTTDAENGDIVNDTVYKRNIIVEEQFNVKIESQQAPQGQGATYVEKSQMSGDGAYDLVWSHVGEMSSLVLKKMLSDFNAVPNIDITQPWWNRLATESLTINGHCYLQMNYIPFTGVLLSHCLYFNKNMAADNGITNLYALVNANEWTFDRFAEFAKSVSVDVNGDGEYDENDIYGLTASHGTSGVAFSIAMGTKPIKVNPDGSYTLTMLSERNQSILENIVALTSGNSTYLITDYALENELAKMFAQGRALFYSGFLTDSYQFFRDMDDDYGLLPFPKYDPSQQDYITTVTGGTGLLGIPKYVTDPEKVGTVTEALAIESLNYVYPAIYETVFNEKLLRDDESKEMFDLIMNGLEIDFGRTFKHADYSDLIGNLVAKGSTDLASAEAKLVKAAEKHYQNVLEVFFNDENRG